MRMTFETKNQPLSAADYFRAKVEFETTPRSLRDAMENRTGQIWVLDVRSRADYEEGHIPGAMSIPYDELLTRLSTLPRDRTIVTYCGDFACGLSAQAALRLAEKRLRVQHLLGGFAEWARRGFPIEPAVGP